MKWIVFFVLISGFVFYCLSSHLNESKINISKEQATDIAQKALIKAQPLGMSLYNEDQRIIFEDGQDSVIDANFNNGHWKVTFTPKTKCCVKFNLIGYIVYINGTTGDILGPWEIRSVQDVFFDGFLAVRSSICNLNSLLLEKIVWKK